MVKANPDDILNVLRFSGYFFESLMQGAGDTPGGGQLSNLSKSQLASAQRRFEGRMIHLASNGDTGVPVAKQLLAALASVSLTRPPRRRVPFPMNEDA